MKKLSLLSKFAIASAVPIVLLGMILIASLNGLVRDRALEAGNREARTLTKLGIQPVLGGNRLGSGLTKVQAGELDAGLTDGRFGVQVSGLQIWNRDSALVYADDGEGVGKSHPRTAEYESALNGSISSRVTGGPEPMLLSHVPIYAPDRGSAIGVARVAVPYNPLVAHSRSAVTRLYWILLGGLILLYGVLFRLVGQASGRMRRQAEENERQATHDALTALPNRLLFADRVHQAISTAQRSGGIVAVMIMDLDHFKEINDTLGHDHGDFLLQQIGPRISSVLRDSDTIARLGGDEFAILLPVIPDSAAAVNVADKMRRALHQPFIVKGLTLDIGASVGISFYPDHGSTVESLLQRADVAMYVAKAAHTGCETYSVERDQYSPRRLALVGELRTALRAKDELVVHYQPKFDLATGDVSGVEALLRWEHPERGLLAPDSFIPLAEHTGLIEPLTQYVLESALHQCRNWIDANLDLSVAVNLSVRNLLDPLLPDKVATMLRKWGVPPSRLKLEITESIIMADPKRATATLDRLSSMGVELSIDDFGTGYSSLSHLKRLPVDEIKIDKSFVMNMDDDENDSVIVRSTIDLGRNLGLKVVAEGVESEAVWAALGQMGCDQAQGFLRSRPRPASELTEWLEDLKAPWPSSWGKPA